MRPGGFGGPSGFRPPPQQAPGQSDDWGEDKGRRQDRRAHKTAKAPIAGWDEDTMRMRAPQKREKRESGKSWRDYATDEDFDDEGPDLSGSDEEFDEEEVSDDELPEGMGAEDVDRDDEDDRA